MHRKLGRAAGANRSGLRKHWLPGKLRTIFWFSGRPVGQPRLSQEAAHGGGRLVLVGSLNPDAFRSHGFGTPVTLN